MRQSVSQAQEEHGDSVTAQSAVHGLPFTPFKASRFANSRYAPGTPAGSCRKKLRPVYTYVPLPTFAIEQAALEVRFAGVVRFHHRAILRGPGPGEVEAPLLHPAIPVGGPEPVRDAQDAVPAPTTVTAACSSVTRSCPPSSAGAALLVDCGVVTTRSVDPGGRLATNSGKGAKPPKKNALLLVLHDHEPAGRA